MDRQYTDCSRSRGVSKTLTIDAEFKHLIPALLPEEFKQLEANILRDGCQEPLAIWNHGGETILIDGHNRYKICETHGKKFETVSVELEDRDHAKLWIGERQLGRRNLTDDQRSIIANEVREWRSGIARKVSEENLRKGTKTPESVKSAHSGRTSSAVAKGAKLSERKLRIAQEIKKAEPKLSEMVRDKTLTLIEAKKVSVLPAPARKIAIEAVEDGKDIRTAIRAAKKETYNATVAAAKPKELEGTYRIIYADPPWKYVGLNQADEYGHAERHYDCLDDEQLKSYKVGGQRLVKDMSDKSAVLFLWVTSPLLARCFSIIEAWGFEYKASFVWDKVKHNMGHYNSVRHEFLLICTRGSCKPDVSKLVDSVQSIERSKKHSQKPQEFREMIESLHDHGRKLELFRRGAAPAGWDVDGNEAHEGLPCPLPVPRLIPRRQVRPQECDSPF
jgi:N6-adenosine-specific RNA methylase IME4